MATRSDPRICLHTPGPYSETYYEQAYLARYLGFLLVEGADLVARDGLAHVRTIAGLKRADVIWRRIDSDFADPLELRGGSHLGVPGLVEAIRQGNVAVANALGGGVAETPALLGFMPSLSRRLLGEKLILPTIATWWCGQEKEREYVLDRLADMAISPAFGASTTRSMLSRSVVAGELSEEQREKLATSIRQRGADYIGQEQCGCRRRRSGWTTSWSRALSYCASMRRWGRTANIRSCPAASAAFPTGWIRAPSPWGRACRPRTCGSSPTVRSSRPL